MNAREELALVLANAQRFRNGSSMLPSAAHVSRLALDDADAILAAGYSKPRTITTEAELESLPVGSVIWAFDFQAGDSNSWQLFDDVNELRDEDGDLVKAAWLSSAYKDEHSSNRVLLRTNGHPITVLLEGVTA